MLYSKAGDQLVFIVDGDLSQGPIDSIVDSVYSSIKAHQVERQSNKTEVGTERMIQEIEEASRSRKKDITDFKNEPDAQEDLVLDETYYLDMAAFEFEDTSFLVPKHHFLSQTDAFSAVFEVASGMPERSIQFPGITANEFRGLMEHLYAIDSKYKLTLNDWVSTLKLSTKWRMLTIRKEAVQNLAPHKDLTAVMKVQLGNGLKISEWVRSGYVSLIERQEHFTIAEVDAIGLHHATKLCSLREQVYAADWDTYINRFTLEAHGMSNLISDSVAEIERADAPDSNENLVTTVLEAHSLGNRRLMLDAWERMAKRIESLTLDEVQKLTLPKAIKLWKVRLEARRAAWSLVQDTGAAVFGRPKPVQPSDQVSEAFKEELANIETKESEYSIPKPDSVGKGKARAIPEPESDGPEDCGSEEKDRPKPAEPSFKWPGFAVKSNDTEVSPFDGAKQMSKITMLEAAFGPLPPGSGGGSGGGSAKAPRKMVHRRR